MSGSALKRLFQRPALCAAALVAGLSAAYIVCCTDLIAWKPARVWHLCGRVSDQASNAVADVRVLASGTTRWTLPNLLFGTRPPQFRASGLTGPAGGFAIRFKAASATLRFEKQGFETGSIFLTHIGGQPAFYDGETGAPLQFSETNIEFALRRLSAASRPTRTPASGDRP